MKADSGVQQLRKKAIENISHKRPLKQNHVIGVSETERKTT
jgi:hypothetical protein